MKRTLLAGICFPLALLSQSVDVKGVDGSSDSTTTIEIRKGKKEDTPKNADALWEITDGTSDIDGDSAAMTKEAKQNWKKACDEWKKDFRNDNKDNKIINLTCGTPSCGGDAGNKTCSSKATYKIKTRMN